MKKIFAMIICLLAVQFVQAQVTMKDPVSFKLRNGIEVVVAENSAMSKVFAQLKIEGAVAEEDAQLASTLGDVLNEGLNRPANFQYSGIGQAPKMNISATEAQLAASSENFEQAFLTLSTALKEPAFEEQQGSAVADFYHRQFAPEKISITIAGDITVAQVKALLKKAFGSWTNAPVELAK